MQAVFDGLSQGATYYLREEKDEGFLLTGMKAGESALEEEDGYCRFTMPNDSNQGVTVVATNLYLYAEVTVLKVDGANGNPLNGAAFAAYRKAGDQYQKNATGTWTELEEGKYCVRLPLASEQGDSFKLQELKAPDGYVLEYPWTEVTVEPGESLVHGDYDKDTMAGADREKNDEAMLEKLIFPNYLGCKIEITKYDNMKEGANPQPLEGATFTLYTKDEEGSWQVVTDATTGEDGRVVFTVESGRVYAVTESHVPEGYKELQGLFVGDIQMQTEDGTAASGSGTAIRFHLVNQGESVELNNTYVYRAYNTPYVPLEIRKQDVSPQAGGTPPTAGGSVYEVPEDTPQSLTEAEVAKLMEEGTPIREDVSVTERSQDGLFSYADASTLPALGSSIVGGKTYLAVETSSSYTQIRDHGSVVWYQVFYVPAGSREKQTVTLKTCKVRSRPI